MATDYARNISYCFTEQFRRLRPSIRLNTKDLYKPVSAEEDTNFFRNDWTTLAFRGFASLLRRHSLTVNRFLTIGTGSGLDAIGAIEAFDPKEVVVTELDRGVLEKAQANIDRVKSWSETSVVGLTADVVAPNGLRKLEGRQFDLIYENLPNLPSTLWAAGRMCSQPANASFVDLLSAEVPERYATQLLSSHYLAARNLRPFLAPTGGIICNIGGRVPFAVIKEMFASLSYRVDRLVFELKLQTEAEWNLPAYAQWEESHRGLKFAFYPYSLTTRRGFNEGYDRISGFADSADQFERFLQPDLLNAVEAAREFRGHPPKPIAHTAHTLFLQPVPQKNGGR